MGFVTILLRRALSRRDINLMGSAQAEPDSMGEGEDSWVQRHW
jgi:hypothetical protein